MSENDVLLLTPGDDNWNRVVAMPFPRGGREPLAVFKLARVPERNTHTEREQRVLADIRSVVDPETRRTLPEGFGVFSWRGLTVGMESYLSGRLLAATSARWGNSLGRKIRDLDLAVDWLISFHLQTQAARPQWGDPELAVWSDGALDRYGAAFGDDAPEQDLFRKTRSRLRELTGSRFPIVWCHNGFSAWNICRENDEIGVFDWESGERGPALFDLIYLVFRWNLELSAWRGRGGHIRAFRELFVSGTGSRRSAAPVYAAIRRYMAALEIDPRSFPLAFVAHWAIRAMSRVNRAQLGGQLLPNPRQNNVYVRYLGVLAEDPVRFFERW
jgi:hypothetical protein